MGIRAPYLKNDKDLELKINQLRNEGHIVIVELPDQAEITSGCDRQLVLKKGEWIVEEL